MFHTIYLNVPVSGMKLQWSMVLTSLIKHLFLMSFFFCITSLPQAMLPGSSKYTTWTQILVSVSAYKGTATKTVGIKKMILRSNYPSNWLLTGQMTTRTPLLAVSGGSDNPWHSEVAQLLTFLPVVTWESIRWTVCIGSCNISRTWESYSAGGKLIIRTVVTVKSHQCTKGWKMTYSTQAIPNSGHGIK